MWMALLASMAWGSPVVPTPGGGGCDATTDAAMLSRFALSRPQRLLEVFPDSWVASHHGVGGAPDVTAGGFAGAHTQDVAVMLYGLPMNHVGHLHAAGWTALDVIPTSLIQQVQSCRGPSRVDLGAFANSGSLHLSLEAPHPGFQFRVGGGTDGSGMGSLTWRPRTEDSGTFLATELEGGEGVGGSRSWRHFRIAGGYSGGVGAVEGRLLVLLHDGDWEHPGPRRAEDIASSSDFYSAYRTTSGSLARQALLLGDVRRDWSHATLRSTTWARVQHLILAESFTGVLADTVTPGVSRERASGGELGADLRIDRRWFRGPATHMIAAGILLRGQTDQHHTEQLDRDGNVVGSVDRRDLQTTQVGAWTEGVVGLAGLGHLRLGGRLDRYDLRTDNATIPTRSDALILSPNARLDLATTPWLRLYAGYGRAHHPPLPGSGGRTEVPIFDHGRGGIALDPVSWLSMSVDAFGVVGQREVVREPTDRRVVYMGNTRRAGLTSEVRVHPWQALDVMGSLTWTDARDDAGGLLSYVPRWSGTGGVGTTQQQVGPFLLTSQLWVRGIGRRVLPGGIADPPQARTRLVGRVDHKAWRFELEIDNLVPLRVREAVWLGASSYDARLATDPRMTRHLVAGEPFAMRISFGARL